MILTYQNEAIHRLSIQIDTKIIEFVVTIKLFIFASYIKGSFPSGL